MCEPVRLCVDDGNDILTNLGFGQVTFSERLNYIHSLAFDWCHAPTGHQFLEHKRLTRMLTGNDIDHSLSFDPTRQFVPKGLISVSQRSH
jgi:hypothetical protein